VTNNNNNNNNNRQRSIPARNKHLLLTTTDFNREISTNFSVKIPTVTETLTDHS
jgi:hypothetical protein